MPYTSYCLIPLAFEIPVSKSEHLRPPKLGVRDSHGGPKGEDIPRGGKSPRFQPCVPPGQEGADLTPHNPLHIGYLLTQPSPAQQPPLAGWAKRRAIPAIH